MAADYKEITNLIKLISKSNLTEFKMKDGDLELSIRTDKYVKVKQQQAASQQPIVQLPPQQAAPQAPPSPQPQSPSQPDTSDQNSQKEESQPSEGAEAEEGKDYVEIKSPIVGTFYRSSSPDKPPYAKVGDQVNVGDVVCIVEAMKLFNEIESEVSGKIVKVLVEDASPVEYDQPLFLVDPKG